MPLFIRTLLSRWRFRQMTAPFDREIKAAQRAHRQVRPIQQAKADFVRAALEGRQLQIEVGR